MDDSREVTLNLNQSFIDEEDQDETVPLGDPDIPKKVDTNGHMANQNQTKDVNSNKEIYSFLDEQVRELSHNFISCQKEMMRTISQFQDHFDSELSVIKNRIREIEHELNEKDCTINRLKHMVSQNKTVDQIHTNERDPKLPDTKIHENVPERKADDIILVPAEKAATVLGQNKETTQNACTNSLLDKESMHNVNQNYAVLEHDGFLRQAENKIKPSISMKPQLFDGTEDLDEYLAQFEILAEINGWDYPTKSLYLAGSLKGGARALLNELDKASRRDFNKLVAVLSGRYGSAEKAELFRARLQSRVRGKDESLPELAQAIKKLTRQSYPSAQSSLTAVLALEHFIDAIPDADLRLKLREYNPKSICEAETLAVRLEALRMSERQKGRMVRQADIVGENQNEKQKELQNANLNNNVVEMKKEFMNLTREIRGLSQNLSKQMKPGGSSQFQNQPNRNFGNQNRNFGPGNRNSNYNGNGNGGFGRRNFQNQGNQGRSDSGAGGRPY